MSCGTPTRCDEDRGPPGRPISWLALFNACHFILETSSGIGLAWHDGPAPPKPRPARRNWVRFARFALRGAGLSAAGPNWLCFAPFARGRQPDCPKLGSFCMIRSGQLGLFVQPPRVGPGRQAAEGVPPQGCPESAIHNPQSAIAKLGSFCTIGIGLERWNSGILEWWGISATGIVAWARAPMIRTHRQSLP
jgi:hypothetical protein